MMGTFASVQRYRRSVNHRLLTSKNRRSVQSLAIFLLMTNYLILLYPAHYSIHSLSAALGDYLDPRRSQLAYQVSVKKSITCSRTNQRDNSEGIFEDMLLVRWGRLDLKQCSKVGRRFLKTCITGIGNPEPKYAGTRHNVGLTFLDLLKDNLIEQDSERPYKKCVGAAARYVNVSPDLLFIRSDGDFINLSGKTVVPLWKKLSKYGPVIKVVVHDELSLPLGKVQLRKPGTSLRGHNGLKSIHNHLGNGEFFRLAVGIGRPEDRDPKVVSDYVLGQFTPKDLTIIHTDALARALQLLKSFI